MKDSIMPSTYSIPRARRHVVVLIAVALLSGALSSCGGGSADAGRGPAMPASNAPAALKEQYLGSRIDEVLARSQPAGSAGISLLVVKDGQTAYRRSKGLARTEGAIAIGEGSVFELASLSKTFTAIAVMQLVERAQLRLDDPVTLWLPALPASWHSHQRSSDPRWNRQWRGAPSGCGQHAQIPARERR